MNQPLMTFTDVTCRYKVRKGRFKFVYYDALSEISFSIYKGETLGLIGHNGAGKSTLLKLIANILRPNCGQIEHMQPLAISLLSLQLGNAPELSGVDNAIMSALLFGYSKKQALERLPQIIEFSELGDRIHDPLKTYSTGMKARLGFAVAMELSPDILLVDEVLGVGDQAFRIKSTAKMREKMNSGQTVVFVSHQLMTVKALCSRVAWLENGKIKMIGKPDEVLDKYQEYGANNKLPSAN